MDRDRDRKKVLNPETGRKIFVDGTTYKKLSKIYLVDNESQALLDFPNFNEPERKKMVTVPKELQRSYGKSVSIGSKRFNVIIKVMSTILISLSLQRN